MSRQRIHSTLLRDHRAGKPMEVELEARADDHLYPGVRLEIQAPARRAERSLALTLTPSAARELMKALQAAADRADRQAYLLEKTLREVPW